MRWDNRYAQLKPSERPAISPLLAAWLPQLPDQGYGLDIAAGAGRHSLALARHGLRVDALDISLVGLRLLQAQLEPDLPICPLVLDLSQGWLPERGYQVIVNFFFLERRIWPAMIERLAPGGWLIFETYTVAQLLQPGRRVHRREFLLEAGELRTAFQALQISHYQEIVRDGRATAQLVARKPGF